MYITWHHLENALFSKFTLYYLLFTFTILLFKRCYLKTKETKQRIINIYSKWLWCIIYSSAYKNYVLSFHSQSNLLFSALCLWYQDESPSAAVVRNLPAKEEDIRDAGLISVSGRSPGGGHGNPLQYSCLENLMDRGAWWAPWDHRIGHDWSDLACMR